MALPPEKLARVIIDTDARNEADDQYCIVHALLTPSFEIHGIVPAHFGTAKSPHSLQDSREEVMRLLGLMDLTDAVRVADGAAGAIPAAGTPPASPGAELIVEQAMKADERPLHVAFLGPLTDMAAALALEPRIQDRNLRVVWIGGGAWPAGGREYNLSNDIEAANVVFRSRLEVWQIPAPVYRMMGVGYAELMERALGQGAIGRYLVEQLIAWNARSVPGPIEYRSLGDTPALAVIMNPDGGRSEWRPAPQFSPSMHYLHPGRHRPIRVYDSIDVRFIQEDLFAKLTRFTRGVQETATFS